MIPFMSFLTNETRSCPGSIASRWCVVPLDIRLRRTNGVEASRVSGSGGNTITGAPFVGPDRNLCANDTSRHRVRSATWRMSSRPMLAKNGYAITSLAPFCRSSVSWFAPCFGGANKRQSTIGTFPVASVVLIVRTRAQGWFGSRLSGQDGAGQHANRGWIETTVMTVHVLGQLPRLFS